MKFKKRAAKTDVTTELAFLWVAPMEMAVFGENKVRN